MQISSYNKIFEHSITFKHIPFAIVLTKRLCGACPQIVPRSQKVGRAQTVPQLSVLKPFDNFLLIVPVKFAQTAALSTVSSNAATA